MLQRFAKTTFTTFTAYGRLYPETENTRKKRRENLSYERLSPCIPLVTRYKYPLILNPELVRRVDKARFVGP